MSSQLSLDPIFQIEPYVVDNREHKVHFHYSFSNGLHFEEELQWKQALSDPKVFQRPEVINSLNCLSVALGLSYYKCFAPRQIVVQHPLSAGAMPVLEALYTLGLAEFTYRNQLQQQALCFEVIHLQPNRPACNPLNSKRSLVLFGGGKDSIVSIEVLKQLQEPFDLCVVNAQTALTHYLQKTPHKTVHLERQIDPYLLQLVREKKVLNGHVPITGLISLMAITTACLYGYDNIVLSNERSANEGNLGNCCGTQQTQEMNTNHQYSKSWHFEQILQGFVRASVHPQLRYYSLLRPFSELHIAQLFASHSDYDHIFLSCNQAYRQEASCAEWCCACAKCAFVFLILATALPQDRLLSIFRGTNLLEDTKLMTIYRQLLGLESHKPWECVGQAAECMTSILWLSEQSSWKHNRMVQTLIGECRQTHTWPELEAQTEWTELLEPWLTPAAQHAVPDRLWSALQTLLQNTSQAVYR